MQVFYTAEKICYQVVCYWQQPWIQVGYNLLLNPLTLSLLLQLGDTKPHGNLLLSGLVPGTHSLGHHLLPLKDLALSVICTAGLTGLSEKKKKKNILKNAKQKESINVKKQKKNPEV